VISPSKDLAQSEEAIPRVIDLEPVEGSSFIVTNGKAATPPQATVTLHSFGGDAPVNFKLVARLLRQLFDGGSYSVYLTTRSSPDEYVHEEFGSGRFKFNTDFTGDINLWSVRAFGLEVDDPQITAFIVFDPDDGRAFDSFLDSNRLLGDVRLRLTGLALNWSTQQPIDTSAGHRKSSVLRGHWFNRIATRFRSACVKDYTAATHRS
jgi:hypothetical protein